MNLVNHLAERALQHPDRVALVDADQSLSYHDLYAHVCAASKKLAADGLQVGDTVLILQPVGVPLYISLLGSFHAGLVVMFIDPSAGKKVMQNCLSLHPPDAMIGVGKSHLLRLTMPEVRCIPHLYHSTGWAPGSQKWKPEPAEFFEPTESQPESPALITFTSGSTGMPKAACRSHGFLLAQHKALAESLDYHEAEVDLVTLPVFALANLASGLTSVIAATDLRFPALADSKMIEAQCLFHQVTRCAASPAFFAKLMLDERMPDFTAIYTGGAPVFPRLLDRIQLACPEMNVVTVFGSTEAEPIAHIPWDKVTKTDHQMMDSGKGLLVGKPVEATRLRIVPDRTGERMPTMAEQEFDRLELPVGAIGEIMVTGDHVLKGYLNGKGDEESKVHIGTEIWHRTGDAAWRDEFGRVWLVGRCVAAIERVGRSTIYPFGIECAAMSHAGVRHCALVDHQQKVSLFYEGELDELELQALEASMQELGVEQVQQLPMIPMDKRHNAKVDYPALRAKL